MEENAWTVFYTCNICKLCFLFCWVLFLQCSKADVPLKKFFPHNSRLHGLATKFTFKPWWNITHHLSSVVTHVCETFLTLSVVLNATPSMTSFESILFLWKNLLAPENIKQLLSDVNNGCNLHKARAVISSTFAIFNHILQWCKTLASSMTFYPTIHCYVIWQGAFYTYVNWHYTSN